MPDWLIGSLLGIAIGLAFCRAMSIVERQAQRELDRQLRAFHAKHSDPR